MQDEAVQITTDDSRNLMSRADTQQYVQEEGRRIAREELNNARSELQKEVKGVRKEFISVFGLFAGFITFTVLQIQAFIQASSMSLIMGASSFFAASSLTFVICLHNMINDKNRWKDFKHPIFVVVLLMFAFSLSCFAYYVSNKNVDHRQAQIERSTDK